MLRIVIFGAAKCWIQTTLILATIFISSQKVNAQQMELVPSTKQPSAAFGYSIAHSNVWSIAGAKDDTIQAGRTGAAYFFKFEDGLWVEKQKVGPDNGEDGDNYGTSVFLDETWISIGSPYYTTNNGITGAAFTINAPLPVGLAEREALAIFVYPNPVAGELRINLPLPSNTEVEITVVEVKGEKVLNAFYQSVSSSTVISLDVANLQHGLYLVRIKSKSGVFVAKFYRQ